MFTGLVEELGEVVAVEPAGDSLRLTVRGPEVTAGVSHGDSIAVAGVCLTVVASHDAAGGPGTFTADVMAQTLRMSTLADLEPGSRVNLERAARVDSRLGGHIVQGHIDGTATVLSVDAPAEGGAQSGAWHVVRFSLSEDLAPLVVDKGSLTLSGVSLTVSAVSAAEEPNPWFEVSLIPETLAATTLGSLEPGESVNVETDILARHIARMLHFQTPRAHARPTEGAPR